MKFYKGIGDAVIEVSGKWIKVKYTIGGRAYFIHNGKRYNLNDFMYVKENSWANYPDYLQEFDGVGNSSYAGVDLIKINGEGDKVKYFNFHFKENLI